MSFTSNKTSLDAIMKQKLTRYRLEVANAHRALQAFQAGDKNALQKAFIPENFDKFIQRLGKDYPEIIPEVQNVRQAMATGELPNGADVSTPAKQLLWGAGLTHFMAYGGEFRKGWKQELQQAPLNDIPFFAELKKSKLVRKEMIRNAEVISSLVSNPETRLRWGLPGSWFYFDNRVNLINMDLLFSLIGGFEHVRSITFHEIGHSQLSTIWPPSMQEAIDKQNEMRAKAMVDKNGKKRKKPRMKKDEYKEMMRLSFKTKLMHRLFNPGEDNCVNRYAVRQGQKWPQDYGYSLNHISGTLTGVGQAFLDGSLKNVKGTSFDDYEDDAKDAIKGKKKKDKGKEQEQQPVDPSDIPEDIKKAEDQYRMLCHAVNMSFFVNNGLFEDTPEGWKSIGVDQDVIRSLFRFSPDLDKKHPIRTLKKGDELTDFDGFAYLRELCSGKRGLENLQPSRKDELMGRAYVDSQIKGYNEERNAIMEEILDRYAQPLIDKILEFQMDQLQQQMDQKQDQDQENDQDQSQEGDQGQSQESEIEIEDDDQDGSGEGDPSDDPSEGDPTEDPSGQGGSGSGEPSDDDQVEVDGVGDMDMPEGEDSSPKGDDQSQGNENDNNDPSEDMGESVSDLVEEGQDDPGDDAENDGQDADQDADNDADKDADQKQDPSQQAGGGKGAGQGGGVKSLDDLPVGDWSNYSAMVSQYGGAIRQAERLLRRIKEMQVQHTTSRSRSRHTMLPRDGELDRFSVGRHIELKKKKATGQHIEAEDYNRFNDDKLVQQPTDIDLVLLIDGSGSMESGIGTNSYQAKAQGKATKLQAAIHSACILYEAARRVGINVHIAAWGPPDPIWIAGPRDNHARIGESISRVANGLNSGTQLWPAINSTVKRLSETKSKTRSRFTGFSHCIILSDGDVGDMDKSVGALKDFLQGVPKATVDVAVLEQASNNPKQIEKMAEQVQTGRREQSLLTVFEVDPNKLTTTVLQLVANKLRACKSLLGISNTNKKRTLRQTAGKMGL